MNKNWKKILVALPVFVLLGYFGIASAADQPQQYTPLVNIPGVADANNFNDYLNALYALAISVAALIAVVKIVLAGAEYMLDDVVTHKSEAKEKIKSSLIGLLIILGAVVILNTVNSDLTHLAILNNADTAAMNNEKFDASGKFIRSVSELEKYATEHNTQMKTVACGDIIDQTFEWVDNKNAAACKEVCNGPTFKGIFYDGYQGMNVPIVGDTYNNYCYYLQSEADACDPQSDQLCCTKINGGDWENNSCSNTNTPSKEAACWGSGNTWDSQNKTCSTVRCSKTNDARCCAQAYNCTDIATVDSVEAMKKDCQGKDGFTWLENLSKCTPTIGNETIIKTSCINDQQDCADAEGDCTWIQGTGTYDEQRQNFTCTAPIN